MYRHNWELLWHSFYIFSLIITLRAPVSLSLKTNGAASLSWYFIFAKTNIVKTHVIRRHPTDEFSNIKTNYASFIFESGFFSWITLTMQLILF